jgi:hypothetical protein
MASQAVTVDLQWAPEGTLVVAIPKPVGDDNWPIAPSAAAPNIASATVTSGVATFSGLTNYLDYFLAKPTKRVESLRVDATSGTYTLGYKGETSGAVAFNASATTGGSSVRALLEALTAITPGDVTVSGGPGDSGGTTPYVVTFAALLAGDNHPLTATSVDLAGGGAAVTVTNTTPGSYHEKAFMFQCGDQAVLASHPVARRS